MYDRDPILLASVLVSYLSMTATWGSESSWVSGCICIFICHSVGILAILGGALCFVLLNLVLGVRVLAPKVVEHARHRQPQRADHLARQAVRAGLGHER